MVVGRMLAGDALGCGCCRLINVMVLTNGARERPLRGLVKPFSGFAPWLGGEEMLEVCFEQVAHKAS
jgi:hypothetical protein